MELLKSATITVMYGNQQMIKAEKTFSGDQKESNAIKVKKTQKSNHHLLSPTPVFIIIKFTLLQKNRIFFLIM